MIPAKMARIIFTLSLLTGCSAHSPFIMKSTTDVSQLSTKQYAPHDKKIFITKADLPETIKYESLGQVEVGKVWYGDADNAIEALANEARKLGADAVIGVKTWHQPSGWAWAAPHGSGKAVKILNPENFDFSKLEGNWK